MSNFLEHLNNRKHRYNKFISSPHFNQGLKGLHHLELNLVENCTRKCFFCPRGDPVSYPNLKRYMDLSLIKVFAERCVEAKYKEEIHITGFGEPLLYPNLYESIRLLRTHGLSNFINITTNGDLLDLTNIRLLYESGVSHVTVSCYDASKFNYFMELFCFQSNERFFIRQLWDKQNEGFADRTSTIPTKTLSECYIPFYKMFVDYDGKVLICSNDWFRLENLSLNIKTHSLSSIWFSPALTKIRNNLQLKQRTGPSCSKCHVQGTVMGKESVDVLMFPNNSHTF